MVFCCPEQASTGKTYQDVTALRDPLAGLTGGTEIPFDASAAGTVPTADYSPDQPRDDHGRWTNGFGIDVTQEYLDSAKPGTGSVTYDNGYTVSHHAEEIKTAQWLHENLGGDIVLLQEKGGLYEKTPDFLWNNKGWELKTTTSEKSADSALRSALKQISGNSGGVILDYGTNNISISKVSEIVSNRMNRQSHCDADILILHNGKLAQAFRYKK